MAKKFERYSPSRRLEEVRALLNSAGGVSVYDIAERLDCSVRTAIRYLRSIEDSGDRIYDERQGQKKVWSLLPSAREATVHLTTSQMISLYLSRTIFDFLAGTGFKEDLDAVFEQLEAHLKHRDFAAAANLERKFYDFNEAPFAYGGRGDDMNDILTALIREERLEVVHQSVARATKSFEFDPYTLLVYKKGLYLVGYSHQAKAVRTLGFDGFKSIVWQKGVRFEYPNDYLPERLVQGAFGLHTGKATRVRIFFDEKVSRFIERRLWHKNQKLVKLPEGGVVMTLTVRGTVELLSWVLGFGEHAEILEPESLRREAAMALDAAAKRYRGRDGKIAKPKIEVPPDDVYGDPPAEDEPTAEDEPADDEGA